MIHTYVSINCEHVNDPTLDKIIQLCIAELTKPANNVSPIIQNPSLDILVAIGRHHCAKVMKLLTELIQPTQIAHLMIMYCIGTLATANINGIVPYIKPIFDIMLIHLNNIKLDQVKQSYSFGKLVLGCI